MYDTSRTPYKGVPFLTYHATYAVTSKNKKQLYVYINTSGIYYGNYLLREQAHVYKYIRYENARDVISIGYLRCVFLYCI